MKNKTIKQWLNTLPEPLRSEALKANKKGAAWQDFDQRLSSAILNGFDWSKAKSGEDFWCSFYEALAWAEKKDAKH